MGKSVTFSFRSTKFEGVAKKETFTFEELGIRENMNDKAIKVEIDRIFQAWVWDKLNISFSIVIAEEKPQKTDKC